MPTPSLTVRGLQELQAALRRIAVDVRTQLVFDGVLAGGNVLRAGMQSRLPRKTGFLGSHIEVEVSIANGVGVARIGPSRDAFYGGILQQGAKAHVIEPGIDVARRKIAKRLRRGSSGRAALRGTRDAKRALAFGGKFYRRVKHPGIRPHPFMTDAVQQDGQRVVSVMARRILDGIDRIAADAATKGRA